MKVYEIYDQRDVNYLEVNTPLESFQTREEAEEYIEESWNAINLVIIEMDR